jgi:hypothetical protein
MAEYNQYRNQQRAVCKGITAKGREDRQQSLTRLKQRKKEIRASAQPWPAKKILLSEAVAASVIEFRALKMSTQKTRQDQLPRNLRTWVAERAAEGDAGQRHNCVAGAMRTNGISGGLMQGWK